MKTSEKITTIAPALLKAQKAINGVKKSSENPFFKSRYANLEDVIECCKKALNDNGISILQPVGHTDKLDAAPETYVETILLHESGEFISDKMVITMVKQDPQAQGSAITYARRYSLQSLVLLPAEDDDAEMAMERKQTKTKLKYPSTKTEIEKELEKPAMMTAKQRKWIEENLVNLPNEEQTKVKGWLKKDHTFLDTQKTIDLMKKKALPYHLYW